MNRRILRLGWMGAVLALLLVLQACDPDGPPLRAYQITRQDQLIGGPSAKGKLGDIKIENDRIRAIIANVGPAWSAGIFGGGLIDVDRYRWRSENRNGKGWDSFSEAYTAANLLAVNPANPQRTLKFGSDAFEVTNTVGSVTVLKDGSDGEAVIRVKGRAAYMFDVLKFLNKDFLMGFLKDLSFDFAGSTLGFDQILDLVNGLVGVNILSLLNRLQVDYDYTTDYILHEGESFLTMRTKITLAPGTQSALDNCDFVPCDEDCPDGYVMQEISRKVDGRDAEDKFLCPVCECAESMDVMPTINESRDIFKILLGGLEDWKDETWKGGIIGGDFLFYGNECSVFAPGLGYDIDRKIFENMWLGVGTIGSPLEFDWWAAVADNVSYAWVTRNPDIRTGLDCEVFRWVAYVTDAEQEDDIAQALVDEFALAEKAAKSLVRAAIVDRKPVFLGSFDVPLDEQDDDFGTWYADRLAGGDAKSLQTKLGNGVRIDLIPAHDCLPSKVLVPLFSTSATLVVTHYTGDDVLNRIDKVGDDLFDRNRSYTFERYLAVGDGDVGSLLDTVYQIRGTEHGDIVGNVFEEGSLKPLDHVDVFVMPDPRTDPDVEPVPASFDAYRALAKETTGLEGPVSQMQSDLGLDPMVDGDFAGPVPPGRYLVMAESFERGASDLVPVTVEADETVRVNLVLPQAGTIEYRVQDGGGQAVPSRLSFIPLDPQGMRYEWDGQNNPDLGDPRYDHGIMKLEFSTHGEGTVRLPGGHYDILVSRGFEFSIAELKNFEVKAGQTVPLQAVLYHEMETPGYVSGDFHVHMRNSVDSGLPVERQIAAIVSEGLEFVTSSDHDHLSDYDPTILEMGLERFLQAQVGVETSPLEYGHFNGYPLDYDDTDLAVHGPPQWAGVTLARAWELMKEAVLGGDPDDFVLQVNHARDGFTGFFAQLGMKPYDLERATPGMEMCNASMEEAPCGFQALEILNGKTSQYLHTPTVWEVERHNRCYEEIVSERDRERFPLGEGDPADSVCGWLQVDPDSACETVQRPTRFDLSGTELEDRLLADHCDWHLEFRTRMAGCAQYGRSLIDCKRIALEALKQLSVRYMVERTPRENDALFATTDETAVGADFVKAMMGCETAPDAGGDLPAGCGEECPCETCVCDLDGDCCETVADGGTGWDDHCVELCRNECLGCEIRPCTERFQLMEDWFALLDVGFNVTGMANSDSHNTSNLVGLPRTYVASDSDDPMGVEPKDINRMIRAGKTILSGGPYVEFEVIADGGQGRAGIGETLDASGATKLEGHVKVQTPSWFRVDRVEIYSNSRLVKRFFPDPEITDIVDLDATFELGLAQDAWFIAVAYGLNDDNPMTPLYKRVPYGHILIPTVISLAATQLLASFGDLLDMVGDLLGDIDDLLGSLELPDSFPVIPWGASSPVWVDLDGDGFDPANADDADGDGHFDLPSFCSRPCIPIPDGEGKDTRADCGLNQTCVTQDDGSGRCMIPIPDGCVGVQSVGDPQN